MPAPTVALHAFTFAGAEAMSDPIPVVRDNSSLPAAPVGEPSKAKRGFATMDPARVRELARRGGAAAHRAGTAHEFSSDEARAAGRRGGLASRSKQPTSAPSTEVIDLTIEGSRVRKLQM